MKNSEMEAVIKEAAKELLTARNSLYSGLISGRDFQEKSSTIHTKVRDAYGSLGVDIFNAMYKKLSEFKEVY